MGEDEIQKIMKDIRDIKIQGARNVAVAGARIIGIAARGSKASDSKAFISEMKKLSKKIVALRPTEPALRSGQEFIVSGIEAKAKIGLSVSELKKHALLLSSNYVRESEMMLSKIAEHGANSIRDGDCVMTHCHSHCVVEILLLAKRMGRKFSVIVTETRPRYQGEITARELLEAGIDVIYCVDAASAALMKRATKVLVGADAITAEGSIVNKIGTYQIAIVAHEYKVPFFVACGTHKYDPRTALGFPEPIEERNVREVISPAKLKGAKILNPAFDETPKEYIQGIITERGVFSPETLLSILVAGKGSKG